MGFEPDDKKLKRAGLDYWHLLDITYYENIDDFFEKTKGGKYFFFSTKGNDFSILSQVSLNSWLFISLAKVYEYITTSLSQSILKICINNSRSYVDSEIYA